jgi:hypothetical protein
MNNAANKGGLLNICLPSLIYLILGLISLIMMIFHKFKAFFAFIQLLVIIFWTWILNLICSAGYTWVSWVLVLLPFIIILFAFLYILFTLKKEDNNHNREHKHRMYREYFIQN